MNKQEIKLLDEAFGLPETTKWVSFGEGHTNETWFGELEGEEPVVLRRFNPNRTEDQILSEIKCLDLLQNMVDCTVPKALYGVNQQRVTEVEGAHYSLFEYIEGVTPALDEAETCTLSGLALANLHIKLWERRDEFRFAEEARPCVDKSSLKSGMVLSSSLGKMDAASSLDSKFLSVQYWADIEAALSAALTSLSVLDDTKHLVHGDFGPPNVLVNESTRELAGILDWDECRWDLPIYDVASVYPFLCEIDDALGDAFVDAYFKGLQGSSHPLAARSDEARALMGAVHYVATYKELELMVDNHLDEPEYLAELLQQLA
ncbi:aminoglycoside phosphotransferase family protein [Pseudovibrio sp. Tun.PSC04-5.I4]|uniref:phosphotransferase enzyme family protein n=1 Tax=Pseudovibrio sp. Tun.PSC04-5.I4 TaxID=1798213 RepID=UPI000880E897|nr:aminoglycoside phosphotransferase family protein [Pseudovibrio sp. Tun.PSC04-5.I4]SDR29999.1 Ser/Thr protein kinase RdoA involved in Cpx stress response, MazF antagonist [Pseudovibrio sp. Tun.PSC04-5.I4]